MRTFTTIRDSVKSRLNLKVYPGQYGKDHLLEKFVDLVLALDKLNIKVLSAKRASYDNIEFSINPRKYSLDLFLLHGVYSLEDYYQLATNDQITTILNHLDIGPY